MENKTDKVTIGATSLFYILIIFEIIFMSSPVALFYYAAYGPILNVFNNIPGGEWLSSFFMPHFTYSRFHLFNYLHDLGWIIFLSGLITFLYSAVLIYYSKFKKRGATTGGLYKVIRHPQYTSFIIMGFGTLLIWPRFFILIFYLIMLFFYFMLALKEENECLERFDDSYKVFLENTSMFIPGDKAITKYLRNNKLKKGNLIITGVSIYCILTIFILVAAFSIRDFSINTISANFDKNSATISTANITDEEFSKILALIKRDSSIQATLKISKIDSDDPLLNYIAPVDWILPDIPMDDHATSWQDHAQSPSFDRHKYKVLFTRVKTSTGKHTSGRDIIKYASKRIPILTAHLDIQNNKVISLAIPPETVLWGDIPTPIY